MSEHTHTIALHVCFMLCIPSIGCQCLVCAAKLPVRTPGRAPSDVSHINIHTHKFTPTHVRCFSLRIVCVCRWNHGQSGPIGQSSTGGRVGFICASVHAVAVPVVDSVRGNHHRHFSVCVCCCGSTPCRHAANFFQNWWNSRCACSGSSSC